jgi:hypothetical protein
MLSPRPIELNRDAFVHDERFATAVDRGYVAADRGLPLAVALLVGTVAWVAVALPLIVWNRRRNV